jgi:hypothetical protein
MEVTGSEEQVAELKEFGFNQRGKLMLTDHDSEVWYRNFMLHHMPEEAGDSSLSPHADHAKP